MLVVAASRPTSRQSSSFSASAHSAFGTRGSRSPASIETNDRDMSPMSGAARGAAYTSRMYAASIRARHPLDPCALAASIGAARARSLLEHRKRTPERRRVVVAHDAEQRELAGRVHRADERDRPVRLVQQPECLFARLDRGRREP